MEDSRVPALTDHCSDPAFAIDADMRIVAWNAGAAALLGRQPEDVLGRPCSEVIQSTLPDGAPLCSASCPARAAFAQCRPFSVAECISADAEGQPVRVALSTLVMPPTPNARSQMAALVFLRPNERSRADSPSAADAGMIRVNALGRFRLSIGAETVPTERWKRKQAIVLLKVLLTHRRRALHRDQLVDCLWPDASEAQGRERLKVTLYALRRELARHDRALDVVVRDGETYALAATQVRLDVEEFETLIAAGQTLLRQGRDAEALRRFETATRIYRGDYLEDDPYTEWCIEERERLRELYLSSAEYAASLQIRHGQSDQAVALCRAALQREPCRESLYRVLMRALLQMGRRDEAVAQYQACARALRRELDIAPMPETDHLYALSLGIRDDTLPAQSSPITA